MHTDTLSIASANMVLFAARQKGIDDGLVLEQVGLQADQLGNPDGRLTIGQMQHIWQLIAEQTDAARLALELGDLINPVAVGALAYVMMHCPTLGDAMQQLCRYQAIVCQGTRTTLTRQGDHMAMTVAITSSSIRFPNYIYNAELSVCLAAFRALTGQPLPLLGVELAYPQPADTGGLHRTFGNVPLVFDAPETRLLFPASALTLPVINASAELMTLFESRATQLLSQLDSPPLASRVRTEIIALMKGEEPTLAAVADRLALGVRTLQGHLRSEGLTYQTLLDEVRKEMAVQHLRQAHLSATDIAYLLGYAEPSVFYRSFKKWTGQTPGAFRQQALAA
jgi:AraC-like DNA-binding protein